MAPQGLLSLVAAGTMSQEEANNLIERLASRIDEIIDGKVPSGGRERTPIGQWHRGGDERGGIIDVAEPGR